mgnify:CR=1 FL=1
MVDQSRLEDLRRRVQKDPASIAFAQLAEEYRRAGQYTESVDACRAGLALHPGYLSARVTLGRALIELDQLDDAQQQLETVLKSAPENLAAIRGLAEIHHRRGALPEALAQYQAALALARNDPELEQTVSDLTRTLAPPRGLRGHEPEDALSFEQMRSELARCVPDVVDFAYRAPVPAPPPVIPPPVFPPAEAPAAIAVEMEEMEPVPAAQEDVPRAVEMDDLPALLPVLSAEPGEPVEIVVEAIPEPPDSPEKTRALVTIGALEQWLAAIHAARTEQRA